MFVIMVNLLFPFGLKNDSFFYLYAFASSMNYFLLVSHRKSCELSVKH